MYCDYDGLYRLLRLDVCMSSAHPLAAALMYVKRLRMQVEYDMTYIFR